MKPSYLLVFSLLILISCEKKNSNNSNVDKLLFDQYKESEHFYETNLTDYKQFISGYIAQNPQLGLFPSFDSISRINSITERTIREIDTKTLSEKKELIQSRREEIEKLSHYKFDFIDLQSLEGLNDSLYNQAIKTDLLKANYNIFLQYSHDKMRQ